MRPAVRTALIAILAFILWMTVVALSGCATHTAGAVPWEAPIPDYTAPEPPTKAPELSGSCDVITALSEPCTGLLLPPAEVQFLYETDEQAQPLRDLIHLCAQGRAADRAWADEHYARILAERDKARRQRWETFAIGGAVGAGVTAGLLTAIVLSANN